MPFHLIELRARSLFIARVGAEEKIVGYLKNWGIERLCKLKFTDV